jgi:hypothetical protein
MRSVLIFRSPGIAVGYPLAASDHTAAADKRDELAALHSITSSES